MIVTLGPSAIGWAWYRMMTRRWHPRPPAHQAATPRVSYAEAYKALSYWTTEPRTTSHGLVQIMGRPDPTPAGQTIDSTGRRISSPFIEDPAGYQFDPALRAIAEYWGMGFTGRE